MSSELPPSWADDEYPDDDSVYSTYDESLSSRDDAGWQTSKSKRKRRQRDSAVRYDPNQRPSVGESQIDSDKPGNKTGRTNNAKGKGSRGNSEKERSRQARYNSNSGNRNRKGDKRVPVSGAKPAPKPRGDPTRPFVQVPDRGKAGASALPRTAVWARRPAVGGVAEATAQSGKDQRTSSPATPRLFTLRQQRDAHGAHSGDEQARTRSGNGVAVSGARRTTGDGDPSRPVQAQCRTNAPADGDRPAALLKSNGSDTLASPNIVFGEVLNNGQNDSGSFLSAGPAVAEHDREHYLESKQKGRKRQSKQRNLAGAHRDAALPCPLPQGSEPSVSGVSSTRDGPSSSSEGNSGGSNSGNSNAAGEGAGSTTSGGSASTDQPPASERSIACQDNNDRTNGLGRSGGSSDGNGGRGKHVSGRADSKARITIKPRFLMSGAEYNWLNDNYPEIIWDCSNRDEKLHSHPLAHCAREAGISEMLRKLYNQGHRSFLLVGLKPNHVNGIVAQYPDIRIHFSYGEVAQRDSLRYARLPVGRMSPAVSACRHSSLLDPETCHCILPEVFIIWDRVYYTNPGVILQCQLKFSRSADLRVFSCHQVFDAPRGGLFVATEPEFRYKRYQTNDGDRNHCYVRVTESRSRFNDYVHDAADWLTSGSFVFDQRDAESADFEWIKHLPEKFSLAWTTFARSTQIETVEFQVTPSVIDPMPERPDLWKSSDYFGDVDFGFTALKPNGPEIPMLGNTYSVGPHLITTCDGEDVLVLKDFVCELALFFHGRTLNQDNIDALYNQGRTLLRGYAIPAQDKSLMLHPAVAMAIAISVKEQARVGPFIRGIARDAAVAGEGSFERWYSWLPSPLDAWAADFAQALRRLESGTSEDRKAAAGLMWPIVKFLLGKGLRSVFTGWLAIYALGKATGVFAASTKVEALKTMVFAMYKAVKQLAQTGAAALLKSFQQLYAWFKQLFGREPPLTQDEEEMAEFVKGMQDDLDSETQEAFVKRYEDEALEARAARKAALLKKQVHAEMERGLEEAEKAGIHIPRPGEKVDVPSRPIPARPLPATPLPREKEPEKRPEAVETAAPADKTDHLEEGGAAPNECELRHLRALVEEYENNYTSMDMLQYWQVAERLESIDPAYKAVRDEQLCRRVSDDLLGACTRPMYGALPYTRFDAGYLVGWTYCAGDYHKKAVRPNARYKVKGELGAPHEPKPLYNVGIAMKDIGMGQDMYCGHNERAGLLGRVLMPCPAPEPGYWQRATPKYVELFNDGPIPIAPFETWVARFPSKKQVRYRHGRDNNSVRPRPATNAKVTAHVKVELNYNVNENAEPIDHDPRLIQASSAEESAEMGPYIWSRAKARASHQEAGSFRRYRKVFYCSGMKAPELDRMLFDMIWEVSDGFKHSVCYITIDGKRFDAHQFWATWWPYMKSAVADGASPDTVYQMMHSGELHGRTTHGITYHAEDGQRSGQTTTSNKNSDTEIFVLNEALTDFYALAADNSDDAFVVCREADVQAVVRSIKEEHDCAGIELEIAASRNLGDLEFCSGRFWPAKNLYGFAYGPKPFKLLPKIFSLRDPKIVGRLDRHMRGVCLGLRASVAHLPIAREYLDQVLNICERTTHRKAGKRTQKLVSEEYRITRDKPEEMSVLIFEEYQRIYGLTPADVKAVIKQIRSIDDLPAIISHPLFKHCNDVDKAGAPTPDRDPPMTEELRKAGVFAASALASKLMVHGIKWMGSVPALYGICEVNKLAKKCNPALFALLVAPVIEEVARCLIDGHSGPWLTSQLIVNETVAALDAGTPWWGRIPANLLHSVNYLLTAAFGWYALPLNISLHIACNAAILLDLGGFKTALLKEGFINQVEKRASEAKEEKVLEPCVSGIEQSKNWFEKTLDWIEAKLVDGSQPDVHALGGITKISKQPLTFIPKVISNWMEQNAPRIKPRKAARNHLRQEVIASHLSARAKEADNAYLRTLVDPEQYRGVRYPDLQKSHTAMLPALLNHNMYYFPQDSSTTPSTEPAGLFLNVVSPTILQPVLEYVMDKGVSQNARWRKQTQRQGAEVGIFPLTEDAPTIASNSGQMVIVCDGRENNIRGYSSWSDQEFATPGFRIELADGSVAYGSPVCSAGSSGAITLTGTFQFTEVIPTGSVVHYTAGNAAGTTVTGSYTTLAGDTKANISLDAQSLFTARADGLQRACALPGLWTRLRVVNNAASIPTNGISFIAESITGGPGAAPIAVARFNPVDFKDAETYERTVDKYRVVSMSSWVEYDGSTLNNGGQIAALYYGGGQSFAGNGLYTYDNVASTPGNHQGGLKTGSYSWWEPGDPRVMNFRRLGQNERWEMPYIVNVGVAADPTQINSLRLRVPSNIEIVSDSQVYQYGETDMGVEAIEHALDMLKHFPHSMENPTHMERIRGLLNKAAGWASGIANWAMDNKSWLLPAGQAAASLLL